MFGVFIGAGLLLVWGAFCLWQWLVAREASRIIDLMEEEGLVTEEGEDGD